MATHLIPYRTGISCIRKCSNVYNANRFAYNELSSLDSNRGSLTGKVVPLPYNLNILFYFFTSNLYLITLLCLFISINYFFILINIYTIHRFLSTVINSPNITSHLFHILNIYYKIPIYQFISHSHSYITIFLYISCNLLHLFIPYPNLHSVIWNNSTYMIYYSNIHYIFKFPQY